MRSGLNNQIVQISGVSMSLARCTIGRAALAIAAVLVLTSSQAAFAADASDPIVLRGPIPDGAQDVTVSLMPRMEDLTKGDTASIVPLTTAQVTLSGGQYAISLDPSDIPAGFIGDGGIVDFEINGVMPDGATWVTESSSRITSYDRSSRLFWTDPSNTAVQDTARTTFRKGKALSGVVSSKTEVEDDGSFVEDQFVSRGAGGSCGVTDTGQRRFVSTTIGTAYPVDGSTAWMSVSSSQGANYGIGASSNNALFVLNGSRFTQSGWSFTWKRDERSRSFRKEIMYGKFRTSCGVMVDGVMYTSSEWKWRPLGETGGTSSNVNIARPNWGNCRAVDQGTWTRDRSDGHAYKYGQAVKFSSVIGIDLSVTRQYSQQQSLSYYVKRKNMSLCGNNAIAVKAGKLMMKRT